MRIETEVHGEREPPIPQDFPSVAFRAGIDLHPVDLTDADAALWLRALVWPEQEGRASQLDAAMGLARDDPPELVEGDAIEELAKVVEQAPAGSTLCIFHNSALIYFPKEDRRKFGEIIEELSVISGRLLAVCRGSLGVRLHRTGARYPKGGSHVPAGIS